MTAGCARAFDSARGATLIALAIVIAKVAFAICAGLFVTPDSIGYESAADEIAERGPSHLLDKVDLRIQERVRRPHEPWHDFAPSTAFRAIGYPLLIWSAKASCGAYWKLAIVGVQAGGSILICLLLYVLLRSLNVARWPSLWITALYAVSPILDYDQSLLTDSLYASLYGAFTMLIGVAILRNEQITIWKSLCIGLLLAVAMTLREATQYLAVASLPLVLAWAIRSNGSALRRVTLGAAVFLPLIATIVAYGEWNRFRTGERFITTATQVVSLVPIFSAALHQVEGGASAVSLFDSADPIDVVGRTLFTEVSASRAKGMRYPTEIQLATSMNQMLAANYGLNSLDIARMGSRKFMSLWATHPATMLAPVPQRIVGALTVLRPLDLRFVASQPTDVRRLSLLPSPLPESPAGAPESPAKRVASGSGPSLAVIHVLHVTGQGISAVLVAVYLVFAIWLVLRAIQLAVFNKVALTDPKWLTLVGFACIFWGFLGFHAAIHMESRYMQPVGPLILASMTFVSARRCPALRDASVRAG